MLMFVHQVLPMQKWRAGRTDAQICRHFFWNPKVRIQTGPSVVVLKCQEQRSRDHEGLSEDPMVNVDMTPWYYVRSLLLVTAISWFRPADWAHRGMHHGWEDAGDQSRRSDSDKETHCLGSFSI